MSCRDPKTLPAGDVVKVERDIWDKERFIAWLESKAASKVYCYRDTGGCLLHQYLGENGAPIREIFSEVSLPDGTRAPIWRDRDGEKHVYPKEFDVIARGAGRLELHSHTFGAALARARNLLP